MSDDGTQYGHAGRHHGVGTPDCPRELHHHHDERCERPSGNREQLDTRIVRAWNAGRLDEHRALTEQAALLDRRQRAREAFDDRWSGGDFGPGSGWAERLLDARETAIETATRVRVTPEIVEALRRVTIARGSEQLSKIAAAAFAAAGFEVEE